ncbi:MAG: hypothetical protein Q8N16_01160 [bacterium]|nr:hypothetical protein [bacterium]
MGDVTSDMDNHVIGKTETKLIVGLHRAIYHCKAGDAVAAYIGDKLEWFDTIKALEKYLQETEGDLVAA